MSKCKMDIIYRYLFGNNKTGFQSGYVEFDLRTKKNKPKRLLQFKFFIGTEIVNKKDAEVFIEAPECWVPLVEIFKMYGYKKPAASVLIKFHNAIAAGLRPKDLWVNLDTCKIANRSKKYKQYMY